MKLYDLGKVPWQESQLIYHALAELGRESLCLVSPASAYVCIGFHQDAAREVDLEYCAEKNIPMFRRDLGGGAVYLDGNQYFFQIVLRRENEAVPKNREKFYRKFLQPVIGVYRRIGIPVDYKPVNDLVCGHRKISGTGAGEIGDCIVFVGNLIMDFNYQEMARVLNVPDEKFRDKVYKTLTENLTTIRRELGEEIARGWSEEQLNAMLAEEFENLIGPLEPSVVDRKLESKVEELRKKMTSRQWLHRAGRIKVGKNVKIRSGLNLIHRVHKAPGGLIRCEMELADRKINAIALSGDFFCFPKDAVVRLEKELVGKNPDEAPGLLESFYSECGVETPGVAVEDWLKVLV